MASKKNTTPLWDRVTFLYRFYDPAGALIYVGITDNVENRFKLHRKNSPWWKYTWHVTIEEHPDRHSAFAAESFDIAHDAPPMNYEEQIRYRPAARPQPTCAYSRRIRRFKFNGDDIEAEVLNEDPFHQA